MTSRGVNCIHTDLVIIFNGHILVIDNSYDQKTGNMSAFLIESFAGIQFNVGGTLNNTISTKIELANDACTLVTLTRNDKLIFKTNQVFLDNDPTQTEALLQPHQVRVFGVIVDDCASRHLRTL